MTPARFTLRCHGLRVNRCPGGHHHPDSLHVHPASERIHPASARAACMRLSEVRSEALVEKVLNVGAEETVDLIGVDRHIYRPKSVGTDLIGVVVEIESV